MKNFFLISILLLSAITLLAQDDTSLLLYDGGSRSWKSYIYYPDLAKENGIQRLVKYRMKLDPEGCLNSLEFVSSPHELLSKSVESAVKKMKCKWTLIEGAEPDAEGWFYFESNFVLL